MAELGEPRGVTYAEVGVDVDIEAEAARILYEASRETWAERAGKLGEVVVPLDEFSGLRFVRADRLPEGTVMFGGSDGVATKAAFAERAGKYDTLAYDLMAMVCDDAVIRGGEPVLVKSVLDVNTLGQDRSRLPYIRELAVGYVAAAKEAGVAVINGEIAQLNDRMGDMDRLKLDWSADVTWFAHESRLITGKKVTPGDSIVGLREEGLRCNGISLVRRLLETHHGKYWEQERTHDGTPLIEMALRPSRIYSGAMVEMFGGYSLDQEPRAELHGAAHISGGGIPEKLGRALRPTGLGAVIDEPFEPAELMLYCQQLGNVTDREAYRTWNMGQGMLIISPSPGAVIEVAGEHDIEAKVVGEIVEEPGITIHSKGLNGSLLQFVPK